MITIKDVEHVAKLARLSLTEEEKEKFTSQLSNILDSFTELNALNTENVEPMTQAVPKVNVMREDAASQENLRDKILKNAPEEENGFFRVPKISEE